MIGLGLEANTWLMAREDSDQTPWNRPDQWLPGERALVRCQDYLGFMIRDAEGQWGDFSGNAVRDVIGVFYLT